MNLPTNERPADQITREQALRTAKPVIVKAWLRRMRSGALRSIGDIPIDTGERAWVAELGKEQIIDIWIERLRKREIRSVNDIPKKYCEYDWVYEKLCEEIRCREKKGGPDERK